MERAVGRKIRSQGKRLGRNERKGSSILNMTLSSSSCESSGLLTIKQGNSTHNSLCGYLVKYLDRGISSQCFVSLSLLFLSVSAVAALLHKCYPELAIMLACFENDCCVYASVIQVRVDDPGNQQLS